LNWKDDYAWKAGKMSWKDGYAFFLAYHKGQIYETVVHAVSNAYDKSIKNNKKHNLHLCSLPINYVDLLQLFQ